MLAQFCRVGVGVGGEEGGGFKREGKIVFMVAAFPPITPRLQLKRAEFSGIFDGNQRDRVQGPETSRTESAGAADTQKHQQALKTPLHFTVNCSGTTPTDLFDLRSTFFCVRARARVSLQMKISYASLEVVKYK